MTVINWSSALVEIDGHKARAGYRSRVSRLPLNDGRGAFVRHTYEEAEHVAFDARGNRESQQWITESNLWVVSRETLRVLSLAPNVITLAPITLPDDTIKARTPKRPGETVDAYTKRLYLDMGSSYWCEHFDDRIAEALTVIHSRPNASSVIIANIGKHWVRHAPQGRAHLMGWRRENGSFIQEPSAYGALGPHDKRHKDYSSTTVLEQVCRDTIGRGRASLSLHVRDWQALIGAAIDGAFGPATERVTKEWQRGEGLEPDGIVGRETWARAGEHWFEPVARPRDLSHGGRVAPAIVQALRDADKAWPNRNRASDGTLGDAAHQARASDHNTGLAIDITHDPASGCDAGAIARIALTDPRTAYVIFDRRIANPSIDGGAWREYSGSNPHTRHVHISIRKDARNDLRSWGWAP